MKNVVPFKAPHTFDRLGIDWTKSPKSERERTLREAYLTYETSCGINGLTSILLLATVSRRQGTVADDLQHAADFAEINAGHATRETPIGRPCACRSTRCERRHRVVLGASSVWVGVSSGKAAVRVDAVGRFGLTQATLNDTGVAQEFSNEAVNELKPPVN